jgi:hypothetical protein
VLVYESNLRSELVFVNVKGEESAHVAWSVVRLRFVFWPSVSPGLKGVDGASKLTQTPDNENGRLLALCDSVFGHGVLRDECEAMRLHRYRELSWRGKDDRMG